MYRVQHEEVWLCMQVTQMKFRLSEGNGECFYYLGAQSADILMHTQLSV